MIIFQNLFGKKMFLFIDEKLTLSKFFELILTLSTIYFVWNEQRKTRQNFYLFTIQNLIWSFYRNMFLKPKLIALNPFELGKKKKSEIEKLRLNEEKDSIDNK